MDMNEGTVTLGLREYNHLKEDSKNLSRILKESAIWSDTCVGEYLHAITKDEALEKLSAKLTDEQDLSSRLYAENQEAKKSITNLEDRLKTCEKDNRGYSEWIKEIQSKWWYKLFAK